MGGFRAGLALPLLILPLLFGPLARSAEPVPPVVESRCPTGAKNETCRCVAGSGDYYRPVNPPAYCNDPRLEQAFGFDLVEYLKVLQVVREEAERPPAPAIQSTTISAVPLP